MSNFANAADRTAARTAIANRTAGHPRAAAILGAIDADNGPALAAHAADRTLSPTVRAYLSSFAEDAGATLQTAPQAPQATAPAAPAAWSHNAPFASHGPSQAERDAFAELQGFNRGRRIRPSVSDVSNRVMPR